MPTSLSDIKVKNSTSTLVIKPDDITINGVSIVGQNSFADRDLSNLSTTGQAVLDAKADDSNVVHKTGNETIDNTKTFTSTVTRRHGFSGNSAITLTDVDTNGKGTIAIIPYYTGNKIYHRTYAENKTSGKNAYLDVTVDDSGNAGLQFSGNASTFNINFANATQVNGPTPSASDNSSKIATTAFVINVLNKIYPVGSLFFSIASTCPLQALGIGTWQNVGTSLALSVNTNVPVKGNGLSIGLDTGFSSYPHLGIRAGDGGQSAVLVGSINAYGKNVGASAGTGIAQGLVAGLTTDPTKSGIFGTVTRTQITVNVFQRIS